MVKCILRGHRLCIVKKKMYFFLYRLIFSKQIVQTLMKCRMHHAAFHLGLHCLPKPKFWVLKKWVINTVKPVLSRHSKKKIGFQDQLLLNAGQKYCRMLQREISAILSTFINLPFTIKAFVLSILSGRLRQVLLYFN